MQQIKKSVRKTGTHPDISIIVKDSGSIGTIPQGGGHGQFTLTITGMRVAVDIMEKIAKRYFTKARRYYTETLVNGTDTDREGNLKATGQTLGQFRLAPETTTVGENRFTFHFPKAPRKGDSSKRSKRANDNKWKLPYRVIQRGKRKGQPWHPKQYNEVAGYIEERKGKPIMFSGVGEIKGIVITELIQSLKR